MMTSNSGTLKLNTRFDDHWIKKNNSLQYNIHYSNWKKSKQPKTILRFLQQGYSNKSRGLKLDDNSVCFLTIPSIKGFTINYNQASDVNHRFLFEWLKEYCLEKLAIEQCSYTHTKDIKNDNSNYSERYVLNAKKTADFSTIIVQIEYQNYCVKALKFSVNNPASTPVSLSAIFSSLLT